MISVVTPTYRRTQEVGGLLENLSVQTLLPEEVILVDGAPIAEKGTEELVRSLMPSLPFRCRYIRHPRGTAIQRNAGIDSVCPLAVSVQVTSVFLPRRNVGAGIADCECLPRMSQVVMIFELDILSTLTCKLLSAA